MKIIIPPIKCQGIKSKLINFIREGVQPGRWVEPFLGSGVVAFNLAAEQAVLADSNPHIINFYQEVQQGIITPEIVREFLMDHGQSLAARGQEYYLEMRDRFNREGGSLFFLFLNRCGFNGLLRFNRKGFYNVPFGHKPQRFRKAYITKIVNQVRNVKNAMRDWKFICQDWRQTLKEEGFVYLDPPYSGRHADYYSQWTDDDMRELCERLRTLPSWSLSTWASNKYRQNVWLDFWQDCRIIYHDHFYHLGGKEVFRNEIKEAMIIKATN